MTINILTRQQSRELDRRAIQEFGVPGIVLMENAGRGMVDFLLHLKIKNQIIICCGKGNNGGDGFVVARHLDNQGMNVHVLLFADPNEIKGDARINYEIALKSNIQITVITDDNFAIASDILSNAECIIDALLGTGLEGEVNASFKKIIQAINEANATIVAVDIPSGLDCDTGKPLGMAIKANHTFTFASLKLGFTFPEAKEYVGEVHIVDIGIPKLLMQKIP